MGPTMTRKQDWEQRLAKYIEANAKRPFQWGSWDCALAACGAAQAMTDGDFAGNFRGQYDSAKGAAEIMHDYAGSLEDVAVKAAAEHELNEIPILMAQRGDIVLFTNEGGSSLGFVGLDGWFVLAAGENGLERVPLDKGKRAWRIQ